MFTDPVKNSKAFNLREDMIVADLGAGTGSYTIPVAKLVPMGKVYVVEIQKDFLATVADKVKEEHLNNVEYIWGDIEKIGGTKLKDSILDAVVVSNVLFQIEDKNKFLEEIKRILKPGGRVFLIDWSDSSFVVSPNISKIISENNAREMFEDKGFIWERSIDAGKHHYGIIFTKP